MLNKENKINKIIKLIISRVVSGKVKRRQRRLSNDSKRVYARDDLLRDKTVGVLNHRLSDTFYSQEYIDLLENMLGSAEAFKNLSDHTKRLIQTDIESLSHDDYNLKTYLHKSLNESSHFSKLFPEPYRVFEKAFKELIKGPNTQRGYRHTISYKMRQYYLEDHSLKF